MGKQGLILGALLWLTACSHAPPMRAPAGTAISGGGNGQVAEFFRLAKLFHFAAVKSRIKLEPEIAAPAFDALIQKLKIESTSLHLRLHGLEVEAINYPSEGKVKFNAVAWEKKDKVEKFHLVVHELLGLLEIPDPQYATSDNIVARARQILAYDGIDLQKTGGDQMLYTDSSGDPVICQVKPWAKSGPDLVEFLLRAGGGVAAEKARIDDNNTVEVVVSYSDDQQVRVDFRHSRGNSLGTLLAGFLINYRGSFQDLEADLPEQYRLRCFLSSQK